MEQEIKKQDYTVAETFELPSGGKIYSTPVNPKVMLRSMNARDEMNRLAPSATPLKTLADIIEGCMLEKPAIHVYDMAAGDYEFLLHKLRIVTYGDDYKLGLTCPYCGEEIEEIAHLDDLELKQFDLDKFNELRTITLPRSQHTVTIKFQTPRMIDDLEVRTKEMKRKYKDAATDFELLVLLSMVIDTVDGNKLSALDLETFINNLPAMDVTKIRNNYDKLNECIGLNTNLDVTCSKCGATVKTFFRFGAEFFRPTTI